jgi:hypothetical protein
VSSHKTECRSYAIVLAESEHADRGRWPSDAELQERADELLATGAASCICSDLPS